MGSGGIRCDMNLQLSKFTRDHGLQPSVPQGSFSGAEHAHAVKPVLPRYARAHLFPAVMARTVDGNRVACVSAKRANESEEAKEAKESTEAKEATDIKGLYSPSGLIRV